MGSYGYQWQPGFLKLVLDGSTLSLQDTAGHKCALTPLAPHSFFCPPLHRQVTFVRDSNRDIEWITTDSDVAKLAGGETDAGTN